MFWCFVLNKYHNDNDNDNNNGFECVRVSINYSHLNEPIHKMVNVN